MSSHQNSAPASAGLSPSPELNLRTARTLAAISAEFEAWMADEIEALTRAHARLVAVGPTREASDRFRNAVDRTTREAALLGYPLVGRIAENLAIILDSAAPGDVPADVIDAHIETMATVATDRTLTSERANRLVAALSDAAAEFVSAGEK